MTITKKSTKTRSRSAAKSKTELPWNVILHNDWSNAFQRVIWSLKKVMPGMSFAKATKITYAAHTGGQALVKSCHKELAELYQELLRAEGLTVTIEPAR